MSKDLRKIAKDGTDQEQLELLKDPRVAEYYDGDTALHALARNAAADVLKEALKHPEFGTVLDRRQWTPLKSLLKRNWPLKDWDLFKQILQHPNLTTSEEGFPNALNFLASRVLHLPPKYVREVLQHPELSDIVWFWSPLHWMAEEVIGDAKRKITEDHLELILNHPEIGTSKDYNGNTPLHKLAESKDWRVIKFVLEHRDANIVRNNKGDTPLDKVDFDRFQEEITDDMREEFGELEVGEEEDLREKFRELAIER
jgi:ankyrin repeat protein